MGAERASGHEKGSPDCGPSGRRIDARWSTIDPVRAHPVVHRSEPRGAVHAPVRVIAQSTVSGTSAVAVSLPEPDSGPECDPGACCSFSRWMRL